MEKKLEKFYVTEAATTLIEVVKDNQCTIITGIPGSGKSALAYYVAIHMQETENYTVVPIWLPSELIKLTNSNSKQLFVFDDVFGKYSLNEFNFTFWESETGRIKMLLRNQVLKIMVTCRSDLYDVVRESLSILSFFHFNLHSNETNLSLMERKEISKLYLTDDVVINLNDETIMIYNFFPLLCVMFKENKMEDVDFFRNPNQFIKNEIENMKSKKDVSFIALSLLVLSNNLIKKEDRQIGNDQYNIMLNDLSDEMDTKKFLSKTSVLSNLKNLKNMYLTETASIFCTKHDKIFDIISLTVGNFIIRCILKHGESAFVSSRLQLDSLNEQHGDCTILITAELERMYFERILKDIENGKNWEVFASIQMKFEKYRNLLMQYIDKSSVKFSTSKIDCTTPLHVTASKGYYDTSKYLIEQNKKQLFSLDTGHRSPLHNASIHGHHELTHFFLRNGAKINQKDNEGYTSLLQSCNFGYIKVVEILLRNHAKVNICDNYGWYPLHMASFDGNTDLIKLLVKHKSKVNKMMVDGKTALYTACHSGQLDAVKLLLEYNANVNKCENNGWTPLATASWKGFKDIAEVLIYNGADINKDTNTGQTPLYNACVGNHYDIVKMLLEHGPAINKGCENENTPLHWACREGNEDVVILLCEFGAAINQCNSRGLAPLHFASKSGNTNINLVKILLKHGAMINQGDENNNTPLHLACQKGNEDMVILLFEHGAVINQCNTRGFTPLHIAYNMGLKNIEEILIKMGAEVDKIDETGTSPAVGGNLHNDNTTLLLDNCVARKQCILQ
ncbi:ankyrin-1-like [Mytilus edulis]|uniref:ankyrin-1-like n=1 Tax=Mytilus edulis TaxID=6550 RepID=UPI0039F08A3D